MKTILVVLTLTAASSWWFWPKIISATMTDDEINACATIVALKDYRREYDFNTKTWIANVRTEEDAMQSLIVDEGLRPDMLGKKASYERQFSIPTVYTKYVQEGIKLCAAKKLRGEKIEFPVLKVKDGYHVTRWNGSASLVKDGEPEPVFGKTLPNGVTIWSDGQQH